MGEFYSGYLDRVYFSMGCFADPQQSQRSLISKMTGSKSSAAFCKILPPQFNQYLVYPDCVSLIAPNKVIAPALSGRVHVYFTGDTFRGDTLTGCSLTRCNLKGCVLTGYFEWGYFDTLTRFTLNKFYFDSVYLGR